MANTFQEQRQTKKKKDVSSQILTHKQLLVRLSTTARALCRSVCVGRLSPSLFCRCSLANSCGASDTDHVIAAKEGGARG